MKKKVINTLGNYTVININHQSLPTVLRYIYISNNISVL